MIGASRLLAVAALMLGVASCGSTGSSSQTQGAAPAAGAAWTGFGARLTDWRTAHPKDSGGSGTGCNGLGCYGATVTSGGQRTVQFTQLSTTGSPGFRVDGFDEAFADGTTISAAEAALRALMPRGTRVTSFRVSHTGGSCALWNLRGRTLGRWFSGPKVGDRGGQVGVDFNTATPAGNPQFKPTDVTNAIVGIVPLGRGTAC